MGMIKQFPAVNNQSTGSDYRRELVRNDYHTPYKPFPVSYAFHSNTYANKSTNKPESRVIERDKDQRGFDVTRYDGGTISADYGDLSYYQ